MASTRLPGQLIRSGSIPATALGGGVISASAQLATSLPTGTVSSSAQIDYNSITNKLSGIVSSSAQVTPLLPGSTVSSSAQVDITATTNYSTFSSSLATIDATQQVSLTALNAATSSYAINSTLQGQLAGVVSSSTQVPPLLPGGTVSASGQVDITTTTGYSTFSSSLATVDATQQVSLNALNTATSSYAINSTIQSQLAGVVSSSTQVKPLLPGGTVSSSGQVDYNSITNKLSDVVSSSAQFNALSGTSASFATTASFALTSAGGGGSSVTVSATAPVGPSAGNMWWNSTLGKMFIYYNDSDTDQWVEDISARSGTNIDLDGGIASTTSWAQTINCGTV